MKINFLKKLLLVTPVLVLVITLFFLNYAVQYFKDTSYAFVYDTNIGSVQRFGRELTYLSEQGYPSEAYGNLYNRMIYNYSKSLGEKDAIITFMLDEHGRFIHSTAYNEAFLTPLLQNEDNMSLVKTAFDSGQEGKIAFKGKGRDIPVYYHRFFSGEEDYSLFMCVERRVVEEQVNVYGIIVPIGMIGLILAFVIEFGICHQVQDILRDNQVERKINEG